MVERIWPHPLHQVENITCDMGTLFRGLRLGQHTIHSYIMILMNLCVLNEVLSVHALATHGSTAATTAGAAWNNSSILSPSHCLLWLLPIYLKVPFNTGQGQS